MSVAEKPRASAPARAPVTKRRRQPRRATALHAHGEPFVWLLGGALALAVTMIVGLLALIVVQGTSTFWPAPVERVVTFSGKTYLGELADAESYVPDAGVLAKATQPGGAAARARLDAEGSVGRRKLRTGNFESTGTHYTWIDDFEIDRQDRPEWAVVVERQAWGRFYGIPKDFWIGSDAVASGPEATWKRYQDEKQAVLDRFDARRDLERHAIGRVNARLEEDRLALHGIELDRGVQSTEYTGRARENAERAAELQVEFDRIIAEIARLNAENARYRIGFETADGREVQIPVADIVRAYPANRLDTGARTAIYASRWMEYLTDEPREANSEGGVFPAIVGTVVMTLLMAILVVPFGVLAALYLREYAKQGVLVSIVRIAVNNLAGVPSIVFGVFGLGFFCYVVGASLDQLLFAERLPNPTYGKGGLVWAAFTLALLTLPVVIVATEESLSAVPRSMREGSYACGATKWQTIRRIVLPRALPGIMTGMILAIARGAGEVAPLMLVGAVKLAPELPVAVDGAAPFVHLHPERSFMHLGFHIYDLGFQSQNSEAAKPMVYTTTLLLIVIILMLNLVAIWVRGRLKRRFSTNHV